MQRKYVYVILCVFVLLLGFTPFLIDYNAFMIPSVSLAQNLMSLTATLLSFFAMFAIYLLNSFSSRIHTLKEKIESNEIVMRHRQNQVDLKLELNKFFEKELQKLMHRRAEALGIVLLTSVFLFSSLMFSFTLVSSLESDTDMRVYSAPSWFGKQAVLFISMFCLIVGVGLVLRLLILITKPNTNLTIRAWIRKKRYKRQNSVSNEEK